MKQTNRIFGSAIATLCVLAAIAIWFLPVEVSRSIRLPGKLYAHQIWSLERSGQGTLHAHAQDRARGVSNSYLVQTIERGDVAEFVLAADLKLGGQTVAGDTIGFLASALSDREVTDLESSIDVLISEARTYTEGAKAALVDEAKLRLDRDEERLALQSKIVSRLRFLREQGAVAADDVDRAEREEVALRGRTAVLKAEIAVLETGARPSEQRLAATRLLASRDQLRALERQRASFLVRTPISGRIARPSGDSVLVRIIDTSTWIGALALPVSDRNELSAGDTVSISVDGIFFDSIVQHIGLDVSRVAGLPSVVVTCQLESSDQDIFLEGLLIEAVIKTRPIRLRERIRSQIADLFRWKNWWGNAARV